jgi:hypothetical protein
VRGKFTGRISQEASMKRCGAGRQGVNGWD